MSDNCSNKRECRLCDAVSLLLPVALYLFIRLRSGMGPGDDAYMTLRFVTNLLAGQGYVYNPGQPVLGTTALYPLLLAAVCKVFGADPISAGRWFLLPFEIGNVALVWYLGRKFSGRAIVGAVAAVMFLTSQYLLYSTLIYMEAPLFAFLILAACVAYLNFQRPSARAMVWIFSGLALICRPEGGILFVVFALAMLLTKQKPKLSDLLWISSIAVPWIVWATIEFGSPIPTSMLAKRLAYLPQPNQSISWLFDQIGQQFGFYGSAAAINPTQIALNLVIIAFGAMAIIQVLPASFPLLLFTMLFWVFYALGNPFIFPWYIVPLEAPFCLMTAVAIDRLAGMVGAVIVPKSSSVRTAIFLLLFLPVLINRIGILNGESCDLSTEPAVCSKRFGAYPLPDISPGHGLIFGREALYLQAAEDLRSQVDSTTTILSSEFGVLGYYLPCRMISSLGHVNPEVLKFLPPPRDEVDFPAVNHAVSNELVAAVKPDYIISPEIFIRRSLLADSTFNQRYEEIRRYSMTYGSYGPLYVFKRRAPTT